MLRWDTPFDDVSLYKIIESTYLLRIYVLMLQLI